MRSQSSNDWTDLGTSLDTLNNHFTEVESVMDIDRSLWMMKLLKILQCVLMDLLILFHITFICLKIIMEDLPHYFGI